MLATSLYRHIIKNMKKLFAYFVFAVLLLPQARVSATVPNVVIVEVQTETPNSASEEYIAVANNSTTTVAVTGWRLQYYAASTTNFASPTRTVTLTGSLAPQQHLLVASNGYKITEAQSFFAPTLSATGGHVRLVGCSGASEYEYDRIGWGSAVLPEGTAANLVAKDTPYKRRTENGVYIDTNNNKNDFAISSHTTQVFGTTVANATNTGLQITELLPDPASPLTDANDEFIELYNGNPVAATLVGYTLQTGANYTYSYKFSDADVVPAYGYAAFYSSATKLALSNTSGGARLLNASQQVVFESAKYDKAPTGNSWQLYGAAWGWNSMPSAGVANTAPSAASGSITKTTTTKSSSTTAAKTAKSKITTAKAASTKSTQQAANAKQAYSDPSSDGKSLPANPLVLAGVGAAAVGYMIYEYRHDIANKFRKRRTNHSVGN